MANTEFSFPTYIVLKEILPLLMSQILINFYIENKTPKGILALEAFLTDKTLYPNPLS